MCVWQCIYVCEEFLRSLAFSCRLKWLTPSSLLPLKAAFALSPPTSLLLPSQCLAAFSTCSTLGCKALHVEGEAETNKSALVWQKQAHRCMPMKKICAPTPQLPVAPCASLHHPSTTRENPLGGRATLISSSLSPSLSLPCDRSKLLRRNDYHPGWHRSEGWRLHHLPMPQWGLVEAGAVLAAGVPQRPVVVIRDPHSGEGYDGEAQARPCLYCAILFMIDRTGAQIPCQPETVFMRWGTLSLSRRLLHTTKNFSCPPWDSFHF